MKIQTLVKRRRIILYLYLEFHHFSKCGFRYLIKNNMTRLTKWFEEKMAEGWSEEKIVDVWNETEMERIFSLPVINKARQLDEFMDDAFKNTDSEVASSRLVRSALKSSSGIESGMISTEMADSYRSRMENVEAIEDDLFNLKSKVAVLRSEKIIEESLFDKIDELIIELQELKEQWVQAFDKTQND